MLERRRGHVLNVSSTAAFFPGPFMAAYYASKAYVLSLSEGLDAELRGTGVRVIALCPPATATGFATRAGADRSPLFRGRLMDAATVADAGYRALWGSRTVVVPGFSARLYTFGTRLVPRRMAANVVRACTGTPEPAAVSGGRDRRHRSGTEFPLPPARMGVTLRALSWPWYAASPSSPSF